MLFYLLESCLKQTLEITDDDDSHDTCHDQYNAVCRTQWDQSAASSHWTFERQTVELYPASKLYKNAVMKSQAAGRQGLAMLVASAVL